MNKKKVNKNWNDLCSNCRERGLLSLLFFWSLWPCCSLSTFKRPARESSGVNLRIPIFSVLLLTCSPAVPPQDGNITSVTARGVSAVTFGSAVSSRKCPRVFFFFVFPECVFKFFEFKTGCFCLPLLCCSPFHLFAFNCVLLVVIIFFSHFETKSQKCRHSWLNGCFMSVSRTLLPAGASSTCLNG